MYSLCRKLSALLSLVMPLLAAEPRFSVCADPNNLPFSNDRGQGFENKLAEILAVNMNAKLEYNWWSERKNFAKQSLAAGACDAVMGIPAGMEDVLTTNPYYRSTYVFVSRRDRNLDINSLADPRLANLQIGVHVAGDDLAPPAYALAHRGITRNVTGFSLFGAKGEQNPARKLVDAVTDGNLDVAIVWGPIAGYFAQSAKVPLSITPVEPPMFLGVPFTFGISAGVRPGNEMLRDKLDRILESQSAAVRQILTSYGVPQSQ